MEQVNNKKKVMIIGIIVGMIVLTGLGISFAFYNYSKTLENQVLVAGDIYMKFTETNQLTLEGEMPSNRPGEKYFEFKITGKNTYSKPIWYEIVLMHGDKDKTRTVRLEDDFLKFRLVEVKEEDGSEKETILLDNVNYLYLKSKRIYVDTIDGNTNSEITKKYRLYMWISDKVVIGNTLDADYDMDTWNNQVYASIKVNVTGDFNQKEVANTFAVDKIKDTLGKSGGVIGVTDKSEEVLETSENIREYRYSGNDDIKNYAYFNCGFNEEPNSSNCELWRIIGVFKDEKGEHVKIVKNDPLSVDILPDTYTIDGEDYNIKASEEGAVYWNKNASEDNSNDWTTAGLQYFLNTREDENGEKGYLSTLKEGIENTLEKTTYYLGNVNFRWSDDTSGVFDTPKQAYVNERGNERCSDESSCEAGKIWPKNQATWKGKVALLYPSDYGFTTSSEYWDDTPLNQNSFDKEAANTSWFQNSSFKAFIWFLNPSTYANYSVTDLSNSFVSSGSVTNNFDRLQPCLNLKPNTLIISGDGSLENPYYLSY